MQANPHTMAWILVHYLKATSESHLCSRPTTPFFSLSLSPQRQWGSIQRVVGAESLEHLVQALLALRRCLTALCPPSEARFLDVLYGEVRLAQDLRAVRAAMFPACRPGAFRKACAQAPGWPKRYPKTGRHIFFFYRLPAQVIFRTLASTLITLDPIVTAIGACKSDTPLWARRPSFPPKTIRRLSGTARTIRARSCDTRWPRRG